MFQIINQNYITPKLPTMEKFKNWILPILITITGAFDMIFGLMNELAELVEIPDNWVKWLRVSALIITAIVLKLQKPSRNPETLQDITDKARKVRNKTA